jgi:hypothetical protein
LELGVAALWHFMAGRGGHEKTFGELKQHLAFDAIPSRERSAIGMSPCGGRAVRGAVQPRRGEADQRREWV